MALSAYCHDSDAGVTSQALPIAPEARYFPDNPPRQLLAGRCRVLFEVRGNYVLVLHVRHVSRDYAQREDFDVTP